MLIAADKRAVVAEARAHDLDAEIETLKLTIAKLQHDRFGDRSERTSVLMDQLELQLGELVERRAQETATDEIAAAQTATKPEAGQQRRMPARRPLPEHLPRERVVLPSPSACSCCGGRLRKLGEDVTETLERIPAQWKVIQHVREKWTCRACEAIAQPPPRRTRSRADVPARSCWRRSCSANTARTCHSTGRANLRARGRQSRCLHAGRLGRRVGGDADAAA